MKTSHKLIAFSILFGLLVWVLDSIVDTLFFYDETFLKLLITAVPVYELYARLTAMASFVIFGLMIKRAIDRRKNIERSLVESEQRYRQLFDHADVLISVYDRGGICQMMNHKLAGLFGGKPEDFVGKSFLELHPAQGELFRKRIREVIDTGISKEYEDKVTFPQGERWLLSCVHPIPDSQGDFHTAQIISQDITDRKRANEALRQKEHETGEMLDQMLNAFVLFESVFDDNGKFVSYRFAYINKAYERITGVKNDAVKGKTVHEVWPGTEPEWIKRYGEVAVSGESQEFELYHHPTKKLYHCQVYRPFDTSEKFCVIFEDITEQKAVERALLKSEQRYRSLFENIPIGLYRTNPQGQILTANQALVDMLGYSNRKKLLGTNVLDIYVDPDDRHKARSLVEQTEGVYCSEIELQREDGNVIWVRDTMRVRQNDHDNVYYEGSLEDITERKLAEQATRQRVFQLAVLNDIGAKIAGMLDLDTLLEKTVELVKERFDYHHVSILTLDSEEEAFVMRAGAGDIAHLYPADHSLKLGQGIVGWVGQQGEKLLANDVDSESRYVNKYPDQILTQSELSVPIQIGEKVVGVLDLQSDHRHAFDQNDILVMETVADQIAVAIENARLYKAEQAMRQNLEVLVEERTKALQDAQERLIRKERLAALGQLAGGIAHQLRHPLSVITNISFLLNSRITELDEEIAEYLALLDDEVHHADQIITDLLDFARTGEAKCVPTRLEKLVSGLFEKLPPPDLVTLRLNIPDDLPAALIDPSHIKQVLNNLIENAYDVMAEGGELSVNGKRYKGNRVQITIRDTGTGISPEHLDKIFEPLFTTKQKGIGLGLAVSKSLIEANNGHIEVESQVDEGTIFRVFLPAAEETDMR